MTPSALLVLSTVIPPAAVVAHRGSLYDRTTRGMRIYLATPRLRGLLSLNLAAAAGGAMVIVNTVVVVQSLLGRSEADVAVALAVFGGGSMLAALLLPQILDRLTDRTVMLAGAGLLTAALAAMAVAFLGDAMHWPVLLAAWLVVGLGYSAVLTPRARRCQGRPRGQARPRLRDRRLSSALAGKRLIAWLNQAADRASPLAGDFASCAETSGRRTMPVAEAPPAGLS